MRIRLVIFAGFILSSLACSSVLIAGHTDDNSRQRIAKIFAEVKLSLIDKTLRTQTCVQSKYSSKEKAVIFELSKMNESNIHGGYITESGSDAVIELVQDSNRYSLLVALDNQRCVEYSIRYLVE